MESSNLSGIDILSHNDSTQDIYFIRRKIRKYFEIHNKLIPLNNLTQFT